MRREQLGAVPSTLTTDRRALTTTCGAGQRRVGRRRPRGPGSGADRRRRPGSRGCRPCRAARSDSACACSGMTVSTPSSSALLRTDAGQPRHRRRRRAAPPPARRPAARRAATRPPRRRRRRPAAPAGCGSPAAACVPSQPARACPSTASAEDRRPARRRPAIAPSANWLAISGPSCKPDQRAAEEAAERQRADDETLPVAADREHQHEQNQDEIDRRHPFRVRGRCQPGLTADCLIVRPGRSRNRPG